MILHWPLKMIFFHFHRLELRYRTWLRRCTVLSHFRESCNAFVISLTTTDSCKVQTNVTWLPVTAVVATLLGSLADVSGASFHSTVRYYRVMMTFLDLTIETAESRCGEDCGYFNISLTFYLFLLMTPTTLYHGANFKGNSALKWQKWEIKKLFILIFVYWLFLVIVIHKLLGKCK